MLEPNVLFYQTKGRLRFQMFIHKDKGILYFLSAAVNQAIKLKAYLQMQ